MGKPTGFLEYERETSIEIAPEERIKNFNEFHIPLSLRRTEDPGCQMYGLWCSILSGRYDDRRYGIRLSVK